MNKTKNKKLTPFAQHLRKEMTPEERHLWYDFLKKLPWTVNRQKVFGDYIADFYIASAKLVIEIDGGQHGDEKAILKDQERDRWFLAHGITVVRYTNLEVNLNFNQVCIDILQHIPGLPFFKNEPSPLGEGGPQSGG